MRRLIKVAIVALGIRALLRWRKRRKAQTEMVTATTPAADPADELRQKLAETRSEAEDDEPAAAPEATVEDRRADVHEQGRTALDDMKSSDKG